MPCAHRGAPAPYGFAFFTSRHPLWIAISLPSPKSEPGKYRLRWCVIRARIWSPRNGVYRSFCTAIILRSPCRRWVINDVSEAKALCPLFIQFQTSDIATATAGKGHVWTAPSWQGESSRVQHWSVRPCVRPLNAVHMTAGHNALRGSGPDHKPAFKNAMAQVGCPNRRIDRLCITCCSPSQPSHHATIVRRDLVRPSARPDNCIARP